MAEAWRVAARRRARRRVTLGGDGGSGARMKIFTEAATGGGDYDGPHFDAGRAPGV